MKNVLTFLTFILCLSTALNAQKLDNSTLWKISGNGLEQPSYLFGTIHITCDATLEDDVRKALDDTSQLVLEIDMDDPELQTKIMGNAYMSNGKTIKDYMSEDDYKMIDSMFIKNMGTSVKLMSTMKPFFLTTALYPKLIDCPMQSFEITLMNAAKAEGEEVNGLETIEEQLQIFEEIPYEDQIKDLVRMAKDNLAYDKKVFAKMLEIYESENITEMLEMMNDENYSSVAEYQDKLLINRNKSWISKIGDYAKAQPTFFGVGAGHLAGEDGVIHLLREAGYEVTAVK